MKKVIIAILVISVLAVALVSCTNNKNNDTDKETEKSTTGGSETSMLEPEDGKVTSDTEKSTDSLIGDIESGVRDIESDIMK